MLNDILLGLVEQELSVSEVTARGHPRDVVERIERLLYIADLNRRQAPPGGEARAAAISAATGAIRSPTRSAAGEVFDLIPVTSRLFGQPILNNVVRGEVVEEMCLMALEPAWRHAGGDYGAWDLEHPKTGLRIQIKQSAARQSWGNRFRRRHFPSHTKLGVMMERSG